MAQALLQNPAQHAGIQFFARSICKSIAKFAMMFGVPVSEILQAIKEAYVEVATEELKEIGQEPSDSKIAIMTGLPRKNVRTARTPKESWQSIPFTNVIGYWSRTTRYLDGNGEPAELPILARDEPSFSELVQEFCGKEISISSVVDFLEASGNIERTDYGTVRLLSTWISDEELELALTYGANGLAWHADTIFDNLYILTTQGDKNQRLADRKRFSRGIPAHLIPELKPQLDKILKKTDEAIDEVLGKAEVSQEVLNTCIFGAGWYLFRQP